MTHSDTSAVYAGIQSEIKRVKGMSKKRYVNTSFWRDDYISNLDPSEKLLFLYFLTNPDTNISGIYQIPVNIIAADTGFNREMVWKIIERFSKDGKIRYQHGWIAIKNFIKNQNEKSPQVIKGIENEITKAPKVLREWVQEGKTEGIDTLSHLDLDSDLNLDLDSDLIQAEEHPEEVIALTNRFYSQMQKPTKYVNKPPDLTKWYKPIHDLHRLDKIDYSLIEQVINFATTDPFWKTVIQSTGKLREKFGQLEIKMRGGQPQRSTLEDKRQKYKEMFDAVQ
jgi:predicted regulator of amino acid metabolism with ACT domain